MTGHPVGAAQNIFICSYCQKDHGSCSNFMDYRIIGNPLKKSLLRSAASEAGDSKDALYITDFILPNSYVAISADDLFPDSLWLIKVVEIQCVGSGENYDDYGCRSGSRVRFIKGYFLERCYDSKATVQIKQEIALLLW